MKKVAQFYLLGAVILIAIIMGMYVVWNYADVGENYNINYRGRMYEREISETIDYCIINQLSCNEELNLINEYYEDTYFLELEMCWDNYRYNWIGNCEHIEFKLIKRIDENVFVYSSE